MKELDKLGIELLENWVNKPDDHYCKGRKKFDNGCMHCVNKLQDEVYQKINGNITQENL